MNANDAIDAHLDGSYPGLSAVVLKSPFSTDFFVYAYPLPNFWHFITFGFSDLWGKQPKEDPILDDDDQPASGYGFELTMRLKRDPNSTTAPLWVL